MIGSLVSGKVVTLSALEEGKTMVTLGCHTRMNKNPVLCNKTKKYPLNQPLQIKAPSSSLIQYVIVLHILFFNQWVNRRARLALFSCSDRF